MRPRFFTGNGYTIISFEKEEVVNSASLMRFIWEEELERGTLVPDRRRHDFIKMLATAKEKHFVKFDFQYLEFVVVFLQNVCAEMYMDGCDTTKLENFLLDVNNFRTARETMH